MKTKALTMAIMAAVLAASIVLVFAPGADADETEVLAEDSVPLATVSGITVEGTVEGNGTETATYTVSGGTLTWAPADKSIGRNVDGWWYGYTFTASEKLTLEDLKDAKYCNDGGELTKSFYNNRDSKDAIPAYLNAWGFISDAHINNAKGGFLTYTYLFDWNGDGNVDQTIYVKMDCTNTKLLDKNGDVVYENGEYKGVAIVDGVIFDTLQGAVDAATEGSEIRLLSDVDCIAGIPETINTNGFSIRHTYEEVDSSSLISAGTLTKTCSVCGDVVTSNTDQRTVPQLVAAFGAIEGYEPTGTASVSANGILISYTGSYTGEDVMYDLARFLGVMHNTGNLTKLTYNEVDYEWNDSIGLLGSNWANGKTTLVSVLVEDFRLGKISDSVTLQLSNEVSFTIGFDAKFVAVVGDITAKGTVTYSQFGDAVAVGGEITLLADVNETATVNVTKDVAIHLNGKALNAKFSVVPTEGVSPTIAIDGDLTKAAIEVTGTAASEITFGTLKLTIPATKTFASDGKRISVSEASVEGIIPQGFDLIASSKLTIPAGKSIEGAVWFDDLKDNGLALSKVTAGTKGVTMTKGSVEIVGDFTSTEDGTITVTGIARIVGDSDLEGVDIVVPKGASLTVEEGITLSGDGTVDNSGTVKVLGNVEAALDNKEGSTVQVALTGSIDMDRVQGKDVVAFDSIVIRDIGAKYYRVGDKVDIPVTVNPTTATLAIDYSVSPSWLSIRDGHIVGVVVQDGSFNVTVKASMEDRETVSESFVLNAVPGTNPDAQEPAHEYTVKEIVKFAVIILVALVAICLVGRVFIG